MTDSSNKFHPDPTRDASSHTSSPRSLWDRLGVLIRLTLVTLTVGGGFAGLAVTLQALFVADQTSDARIIFAVASGAFLFILISGLVYVQNPRCLLPMAFGFALQIPYFSSPIVVYKFYAGFQFSVLYVDGSAFVQNALGSSVDFWLGSEAPIGVGINLVAALACVLLIMTALMRRNRRMSLS